MPTERHRLAVLLDNAGRGVFPAADSGIEVLPPPPGRAMAIVGFTGHYVIATAAPEAWVRRHLPGGDMLAPMSPRFLAALAGRLGRREDGVDVLLAALGLPGEAALQRTDRDNHPRVVRATSNRDNVRVFEDESGAAMITLGRGLALRTEVAVEVEETHRCRGLGTRALVEARRLVSIGEVLFAQTAPANTASLRALLSAGFRPVGGEILFFRDEPLRHIALCGESSAAVPRLPGT